MKDPKMLKQQGKTATLMGRIEEDKLEHYLNDLGYRTFDDSQRKSILKFIKSGRDIVDWCKGTGADAIYLRNVRIVESIYGLPWCIDFFVWSRTQWPKGLIIEVKTQNVGGSVDEKLVFIVCSMQRLKRPCALLVTGTGFRDAAIRWAESQCNNHFLLWRSIVALRSYIDTGEIPKMQKQIIKKAQADLFLTLDSIHHL